MFKKSAKRSVILAIISLAIAALLVPLEILGWFSANNMGRTTDLDLAVRPGSGVGNLDLVLGANNPIGGVASETMLPGDYLVATITLENTGSQDRIFALRIKEVSVLYPTAATENFHYDSSYYQCEEYYVDYNTVNRQFYDNALSITEEQFKRFVAPVTNAIQYELYYVDDEATHSFDENYEPKYLSQAANATANELIDQEGAVVAQSYSLPLSNQKTLGTEIVYGDQSVQINADVLWHTNGSVSIAAGKSIELYLLLYYDPAVYSSADISDTATPNVLTLCNSNPFMKQRFSISIEIG